MAMQNNRSRSWLFTINNPNDANDAIVKAMAKGEPEWVEYFVAQMEVGESGTPHWQGYVYAKTRIYFNRIKNLLKGPCRSHYPH